MTVVPEVILQRLIVNGFRKIRRDPKILDSIFKHVDRDQLAAIKKFITGTSMQFSINYPRIDLKVPAIALLLKSETEAQTFLGDVMGSAPAYNPLDQDISADTLGGHGASTGDLSGLPVKILSQASVVSATTDSITFDGDVSDCIDELLENPVPSIKLYVVGGAGAGKVYDIIRLIPDGLDIQGTFDPQLDSTSVIDIRLADDSTLAVGEPSRVYDAESTNLVRIGSNYDVQYQLAIIAGGSDEVIYLYSTIKAMVLSQRSFLESQGLMALKIGGSDFAPRSEYLPNDVFQRVMTLQFTYPFAILQEQEVVSAFELSISPRDPDTQEFCDTILTSTVEL